MGLSFVLHWAIVLITKQQGNLLSRERGSNDETRQHNIEIYCGHAGWNPDRFNVKVGPPTKTHKVVKA